MSSRCGALFTLVLAGLLVSCGEPAPTTPALSEALVNGAPDTGDLAVVALLHRLPSSHPRPSMAFCSGVLIASDVVLTAAHCIADEHTGPVDIFVGANLIENGDVIRVATSAVHPSYVAETHAFDVGLLRLERSSEAWPLEIMLNAELAVSPGSDVRAIGFGVDGSEGAFPVQKRSGNMIVTDVRQAEFSCAASPSMTCTGDSGGPILATADGGQEQVVGITVSGDPGCKEVARNLRLDRVEEEFVSPFLRQARASQAFTSGASCALSRPHAASLRTELLMALIAVLFAACRRGPVHDRTADTHGSDDA